MSAATAPPSKGLSTDESTLNQVVTTLNTVNAAATTGTGSPSIQNFISTVPGSTPESSSSQDLSFQRSESHDNFIELDSIVIPKNIPQASLTISAVTSSNPSTKAVTAFNTTLALASQTAPSLLRAGARLVLAYTFVLGRQSLASVLSKKRSITLGDAKATIHAKSTRSLLLTQSALQARAARLISIFSLTQPVKAQYTLQSKQGHHTVSVTKSVSIG
jgi:hypothetical protein